MLKKMFTKFMDKWVNLCKEPHKVVAFFAIFLMLFYTVQCSLLQKVLGLDALEAFSWGAQGALGHAKHPPLSGWLSYAISYLGNHQDWILYLAAQLCLAISVTFTYKTARIFFDKYSSGVSALLCYFLFYYNPSETRLCTYPVEMMLIPVCSYNFFRALKDNKLLNWVALGIFCAAGILNKYSFGLVMIAFAVIFFRRKKNLQLLKSGKVFAAAAVMLILLAPHLKWLYENDFVCFKHVGARLADEYKWYTPLVTLATALYPYGMMLAVLTAALLPDWEKRGRTAIEPQVGTDTLLIGAFPALVLVILSFFGDIIMMWFCSMATLTGIALVSFFPIRIDQRYFARIALLLGIFSLIMMTASTLDILTKSRPRVHSDPRSYTVAAMNFYRQHAAGKIPLVIGTRFEATLLEKYLPDHPPACELGDEVYMARYKDKLQREGALLIFSSSRLESKELRDFLADMNVEQITQLPYSRVKYPYKAVWGKKRWRTYYIAYIEPRLITAEPSKK